MPTQYRVQYGNQRIHFETLEAAMNYAAGVGAPVPSSVEIELPDRRPGAIERAWNHADDMAAQIDQNARIMYTLWLIDPNVSATAKSKISDNLAWADAIWQGYYATKALIMAGNLDATQADAGAPPHTFGDIADAR